MKRFKRVLALILTVIIVVTSGSSWEFIAHANEVEQPSVDEAAVLDEMAVDWKKTCQRMQKACAEACTLSYLEGLDIYTDELNELPEFEYLKGCYYFSSDLYDEEELQYIEEQKEDLKDSVENDYLSSQEVAEMWTSFVLSESTKSEGNVSVLDIVKENAKLLIASGYAGFARHYFSQALSTSSLEEKENYFEQGRKYANIACAFGIEDADKIIKNPETSFEDLVNTMVDVGIQIADDYVPGTALTYDVIKFSLDVSAAINELMPTADKVNEYLCGAKKPADNWNDFYNTMVNQYGDYEMSFVSDGITINKYVGWLRLPVEYKVVDIPSSIYGYTVKHLGFECISSDEITDITIPETIESYDAPIISFCSNLEQVHYKAKYAYDAECGPTVGVTSVIKECGGNFDLYIDSSVKYVPCGMVTEGDVRNIYIAEGVEIIENQAFTGGNINTISIPCSVKKLGSIMYNCDGLEKVTYNAIDAERIENEIIYMGVFSGCSSDFEIVIGNQVKKIPHHFIEECGIKKLMIPEGVEVIGDECIIGCENLTTLTIPSTVKRASTIVFGCDNLQEVNYNAIDAMQEDEGAYAFIYACDSDFKVNIADSVKTIPDLFIRGCGITELVFPEGVEKIGNKVVGGCENLNKCVIPSTVKELGDNIIDIDCQTVYYNATSAKYTGDPLGISFNIDGDMIIGNQVEVIPERFLSGERDVELPKSVREIQEDAILLGCQKVTIQNPDCKIFCDDTEGYIAGQGITCEKICGYANSTAEEYADKVGIPFVRLNCKHSLVKHNASPATCTTAGNLEYYNCDICGKYYSDQAGTNEIDKDDLVIKALGHSEKSKTIVAQIDETGSKEGQIKTYCETCGEVIKNKKIPKIDSISLECTEASYNNGKEIKPAVKVMDSENKVISSKNYNVLYQNNKSIGKATAIIKFKGNYSGTVKKTFLINPVGTKITRVKAGTKTIKVTVKKQTKGTTGYIVQLATDKRFTKNVKSSTIKNAKNVSTTLKGLKKNKSYYVRVRTYKKVKNTKYYSKWTTYKKTVRTGK